MRLFVAFMMVGCLVTVGWGQWLETTVPMPHPPYSVGWNPGNNQVYCAVGYPGAYGALVVMDGETHAVIDTIMLGYEMPGELLCDGGNNRVYCAGSSFHPLDDSLVTVVDGAGDTIVADIQVGGGPMAMAYNQSGNKLYCASQMPSSVSIIDCGADTVLATLGVGRNPSDLCYVEEVDKVYCVNRGFRMQTDHTVYVIDGTTNNILSAIIVGNYPQEVCYNRQDRKLYCSNQFDASVSVIDVTGDSVLASVTVGGSPLALCWNAANNRVYCTDTDDDSLYVIDGATNALVSIIPVAGYGHTLAADSANNKVYCSNPMAGKVTVIDGSADTVLATIDGLEDPESMSRRQDAGRTYVCNRAGPSVSVIRDSVPAGVSEERTKPEGRRTSQTIVRGTLRLVDGSRESVVRAWLLDAAGRKVMSLQTGENDISRVPPGVYFVAQGFRGPGVNIAVQRIVVGR